MVSDGSFLAIGVALSLLAFGILLVWGLEQARLRLARRGYATSPIPESLSFLLLGALTATLFQLGFLSDGLGAVVSQLDDSFGTLVLTMLLPPIVMHSALDLGRGAGAVELEVLAKYLLPGLVYAGLGTLISAAVTGVVMLLAGLAGASTPLDGAAALLLGSCLSASDTVAVIDIFERLDPGAEAYALTYIESMFNDAVSIVLFHALAPFAAGGGGGGGGGAAVAAAGASFFGVFIGSLLLGGAVGGSAVLLFRNFRSVPAALAAAPSPPSAGAPGGGAGGAFAFPLAPPAGGGGAAPPPPPPPQPQPQPPPTPPRLRAPAAPSLELAPPPAPHHHHHLSSAEQVEVALLILLGFVAYMVAEGLRASGVVACLACGVLLGRFALPLVSDAARAFTLGVLKLLAGLCDKMVYLGLGIALPTLSLLVGHWRAALWLLFAVLVARGAAVAGSAGALRAGARWAAAARRAKRAAPAGAWWRWGARAPAASAHDSDERAPVMGAAAAGDGAEAGAAAADADAAESGGGGEPRAAAPQPAAPPPRADPPAAQQQQQQHPASPSARSQLIVGWAGSLRGGVAFALAATGQGVLERGGDAEGGRMFPVATLFVVLVTLFGVTLTLPGLIAAETHAGGDAAAEAAEGGAGAAGAPAAPAPGAEGGAGAAEPPPSGAGRALALPAAPSLAAPPSPPPPPRGRGSAHAAAGLFSGAGGRARARAASLLTSVARGFSVPPPSR